MRTIPVCAATGEAAGLGAALAIRAGTPLPSLDARRLADELRARGNLLSPDLAAEQEAS
jgi:hypothetical protein